MRKILQILIPLALFAVTGYAQNYTETFEDGNSLYAEGNYKGAVAKYESIVDAGFTSSTLHYNLGNAYYKQKMYPKAILNYRRALLYSPGNSMIHKNLDLAQLHTKDKIDVIPPFFLKRWGHKVRGIANDDGWAVISLISLLLCGAAFIAYRFLHKLAIRKVMFFSSILLLMFSIFSIHNASILINKIKHPRYAIIMKPAVVAKSSPAHNGSDLFVIHDGTMVEFTDSMPIAGWREIKLADGNMGWVENNSYEVI